MRNSPRALLARVLTPALLTLAAAVPATALQEGSGGEAAQEALEGAAEALGQAGQEALDAAGQAVDGAAEEGRDLEQRVDEFMGGVNGHIAAFFFYPVPLPGLTVEDPANPELDPATGQPRLDEETGKVVPGRKEATIPLAVLWLVLGAIFFTLRMGFVQLRLFGHAVAITRGKYDNPEDEGEVSHFQALTAALSATVGLGNIAGVAIAISLGGPGATLWMIIAGFLGMASKFTECSLGQMYRQTRKDGSVMGGAMYYLSRGLKDVGLGPLGYLLAIPFAVLCMGGSFAGGNSFQVNQSLNAVSEAFPTVGEYNWVYGLVMTVLVGSVILGGLKRIASTAEKVVPTMCGIYILAAIFIIVQHAADVPAAFGTIVSGAMTPEAGFGGFVGVLITGFQRAAFSNEAGVGSAAIAHSAARTEYPVREGIVALLEPFIDTIVVCTMTALVIVITGAYANPEYADLVARNQGAALTLRSMTSEIGPWFKWVFCLAVMLFAFSTMISWSYYGERCWVWLFGDASSILYKLVFLVFTFLGSILSATNVLDFGDLMILGMAFPNILGVLFLSGRVRRALDDYTGKLNSGELKVYK